MLARASEFGGLSHCVSSGERKYSHFKKSGEVPLRQSSVTHLIFHLISSFSMATRARAENYISPLSCPFIKHSSPLTKLGSCLVHNCYHQISRRDSYRTVKQQARKKRMCSWCHCVYLKCDPAQPGKSSLWVNCNALNSDKWEIS